MRTTFSEVSACQVAQHHCRHGLCPAQCTATTALPKSSEDRLPACLKWPPAKLRSPLSAWPVPSTTNWPPISMVRCTACSIRWMPFCNYEDGQRDVWWLSICTAACADHGAVHCLLRQARFTTRDLGRRQAVCNTHSNIWTLLGAPGAPGGKSRQQAACLGRLSCPGPAGQVEKTWGKGDQQASCNERLVWVDCYAQALQGKK